MVGEPVATPEVEASAPELSEEEPLPKAPVETALICILALIMIVLPVTQALLRRVFHTDIPGAGVYVQHATLWISFLGASLATAGGRHLGLATANFLPRGRLRSFAEGYGALVTFLVTLFMAYASARVIGVDRVTTKGHLPGGLPAWCSEVIMPLGFALMGVRVVFRATAPLGAAVLPTSAKVLRGLAVVAVLAALYIGFRYSATGSMPGLVPTLEALHRPVLYAGGAALLLSFLLGAPVFVAMAGLAMVLFFAANTPIASVPTEAFRLTDNPSLPAIPLLTMAGYVLSTGGAARRLVMAYRSVLGWLPGGMAILVVLLCAIFTTFTGASGVTILALGGLVHAMLVDDRYPDGFSLGLVTAAGSLGLLFPPSLPVILYSVAASAPGSAAPVGIDQLFLGGLLPGLLMVVLVALYGVIRGVQVKAPRTPFVAKDAVKSLWAAKWDLLLPVLVIVAFATGTATVVEAAAIGAAYAIFVELVIYRDLHPIRQLPGVLAQSAALVGAVVILLAVALGLTSWLVQEEIPMRLVEWVQTHVHQRWIFLLALNVVLLVLGSVLEIYSAIVVLVPLVAPLGIAYGVNPVHLGVIFLANLELGFLLPPVGLNLFLAATRFRRPLPTIYRHAMPFLAIMGAGVLVITYFEGATLWLLRALGKG